jgi:nucleotide-binding universal stress UspA family protein
MILLVALVSAVTVALSAFLAYRWDHPDRGPNRITPAAKRILFPFVGDTVSQRVLDAALRLARAEGATLVPVYIATIPLQLNIEAPVPEECENAVTLLDTIEMRAARMDVPVESRVETGRSARHALRRLVEHEQFDRLVIPASETRSGFSADDIAWLLDNIPGEIVVLRPAGDDHLKPRRPRARPRVTAAR